MPRRDNIYIDDAVSGLLRISQNGEAGEAYNISSNGDKGNFMAVDEIGELISDTAYSSYGIKSKVIKPVDNPGGRRPGLRLDNNKLKSLGWSVKTDMKTGISKTLEMLRAS